jgi:hypothetical protein
MIHLPWVSSGIPRVRLKNMLRSLFFPVFHKAAQAQDDDCDCDDGIRVYKYIEPMERDMRGPNARCDGIPPTDSGFCKTLL